MLQYRECGSVRPLRNNGTRSTSVSHAASATDAQANSLMWSIDPLHAKSAKILFACSLPFLACFANLLITSHAAPPSEAENSLLLRSSRFFATASLAPWVCAL